MNTKKPNCNLTLRVCLLAMVLLAAFSCSKDSEQAAPVEPVKAEPDNTAESVPSPPTPVAPVAQTSTKVTPVKQETVKQETAKKPDTKKTADQQTASATKSAPAKAPPEPQAEAPTVAPVKPLKSACGAELVPDDFSRQDVYKNRPFQAGESASYDVSYMGIHAGFGSIEVEAPIKHDGVWHQVFSGRASTGEWYENIFIVKDKVRSVSRPWDFGAAQFYIEQNEGSLFGRPYRQKKWINYDHNVCKAFEKVEDRNKQIKHQELALEPGADDALSALFELRTMTFTLGQTQRILVYTSEKNWFLDAKVVAIESVTVPAGAFNAAKLELKTFLGQELQQKGDVHIWLAIDDPAHPMVKVEAEVKIGKVSIVLKKFTPGRP